MKSLESVHPDEVAKRRTRSSIRQDDGGDAYDLDSSYVNDMEVSYDC
jgi:hypothetical protein